MGGGGGIPPVCMGLAAAHQIMPRFHQLKSICIRATNRHSAPQKKIISFKKQKQKKYAQKNAVINYHIKTCRILLRTYHC